MGKALYKLRLLAAGGALCVQVTADIPTCTSQCQVVEDVAQGWGGFCLGLTLINSTTTPDVCRAACCGDASCEVWQWGNIRNAASPGGLGSCFVGQGLECSSERMDTFVVLAGQRISHGPPSDTIPLERGKWCTGSGMRQASVLEKSFQHILETCRQTCYKDLGCSVWQYSMVAGCWYGFSDRCTADVVPADTMVAGERVARVCSHGGERVHHGTSYLKVFAIIGVVALVLTCTAISVLLLQIFCCSSDRASAEQQNTDEEDVENRFSNGDDSQCSSPRGGMSSPHGLPQPIIPVALQLAEPNSFSTGSLSGSFDSTTVPLIRPHQVPVMHGAPAVIYR